MDHAISQVTATDYWNVCATDDSVYGTPIQKALLMDDFDEANRDSRQDIVEVLSCLPTLAGNASILELAAGNGRITPFLAERASRVVSCDLVQKFCQENAENCTLLKLSHVEVICCDALNLRLSETFDLVFINWLFMYLADDDVTTVMKNVASAIKPGGYLFFRESCTDGNEGVEHRWNTVSAEYPGYYRSMRWYSETVARCDLPGAWVRAETILPLWPEPIQATWLWQRSENA